MDMIQKLRVRFVSIMMLIVCTMLIIIFGLVVHMTHARIREDGFRMMENAVYAPMGTLSDRNPKRKNENKQMNILLPFFRVLIDADGKIVDMDGGYYDLTQEGSEAVLEELVSAATAGTEKVGDLHDYNLRYYRTSAKKWFNQKAPDGNPMPETALSDEVTPSSVAEEAPADSSGAGVSGEMNAAVGDDGSPFERTGSDELQTQGTPVSAEGQIIVFADISSEIATMRNLYRTCVIIGLGSLASFLVISIFFARWAVRPVEEAWAQQRQFVSDASHELKTPLTVILTDAEMLKSPRFDEAHKAQFVDNILTMSNQMRGLVESLLQLARVDNGAIQKMPLQHIDLSGLVSDELLTFEALFFEKGLTLAEDIADGITVHGSAQHLKQVVEILLDNAQKYSEPHGTVRVTLQKSGAHHCLLSVADPGDAISPEDLRKIFQRFYRIDEARAMNHSYGLGLSIAENIVKNHKGRIWAESAEGINTFRVELPMD